MNSHGETANFSWQPQPGAAGLVSRLVARFCQRCSPIERLRRELLEQTGTRLVDWIDHLVCYRESSLEEELRAAGFMSRHDSATDSEVWQQSQGLFPAILVHGSPGTAARLAVKVEDVAAYVMVHGLRDGVEIRGTPLSALRTCRTGGDEQTELWVVERHGDRGFEPANVDPALLPAILRHRENLRTRRRCFDDDRQGFDHAQKLISCAQKELGTARTCDLFFAAEREYWQSRNHAARVQRARQDRLGLGWANHDHHTYRSSREHFQRLVSLLEQLGFVCRERFYGGRDAGWGAQVLEQSQCGLVVFADVDLTPQEVTGDFAHQGLPTTDQLGTVGLWCKLHGEAILQAGMHHLECQFDFDQARQQLAAEGVRTMEPFTDLPYLKQAFTAGEVWPVQPGRIDQALRQGLINADQADRFHTAGSIGSHLEILQREGGYKGFNQSGISEIIRDTDPRRA